LIAKRRAKRGDSTPEWDTRPSVPKHLGLVAECYRSLSPKRDWIQTGTGRAIPRRIASTEIESWLRVHGYGEDRELLAELYDLVSGMDDAWCALASKQEEKPSGDAPDCD